jgi:hypothetical protein
MSGRPRIGSRWTFDRSCGVEPIPHVLQEVVVLKQLE